MMNELLSNSAIITGDVFFSSGAVVMACVLFFYWNMVLTVAGASEYSKSSVITGLLGMFISVVVGVCVIIYLNAYHAGIAGI